MQLHESHSGDFVLTIKIVASQRTAAVDLEPIVTRFVLFAWKVV